MSEKTNAIRILDYHHINYTSHIYEVDENHLDAESVAEKLKIPADVIFKTLVLRGSQSGVFVAVIPGNANLDLKKMAKISGNKNCEMIAVKELLPLTGYIRGGCSPIGMKKDYPTFIEELASLQEYIIISAGKKGLQIQLNPFDLKSLCKASFEDIIA